MQHADRANWTPQNTYVLCEIIMKQKANGNYVNRNMVHRAYPVVAQQYYARMQMRHDTLQFRNRLGQLKTMYQS